MTHFEDFDRRKTQTRVSEDERRLRDALYALNQALPVESTRIEDYIDEFLGDDNDEFAARNLRRLVRVRDEVFELGRELYGWTD